LKIYRTFDDSAIEAIMFSPEIWKTCAEDGQEQEDFNPDAEADCWLILEAEEGFIGAYNVHPHNCTTLEIHAHILHDFRKKYAFESGDLVLEWILNEAPDSYQKVIAQIPACYQNVIDFTLGHGFKKEGVNRLSDRVGGVLYDQWLLGITREEIGEYLEG
jgi:RimJ/RimL family protein N-acetyltransferase